LPGKSIYNMNDIKTRLEDLANYGYPLDFGTALEQIVRNFKKIALTSGLVILLLVIIFYTITFAFMGAAFGVGAFSNVLTGFDFSTGNAAVILLTFLAQTVVAAALAPINAGMLMIAHKAETHRSFEFSTAFSMFRSADVREIIFGTVIVSMAANIVQTLGTYIFQATGNWFVSAICSFGSYTIYLLMIFMLPLVIFGRLKALEAISWSFKIVIKKFFIILFIYIILLLAAFFLGLMALCIGIFFTLPIIYSIQYILYRTVIGIDEEDELDTLGREEY
jgi:membrane-anchored glycerophosphoryl diester phosphodiesterase (GDPDase)